MNRLCYLSAKTMPKQNVKIILFRQVEGIWQDVAGESGTLADTLERLNIIIDDCTEFARIIKYSENKHAPNLQIYYRTYGGSITITLREF